MTDATSGYSFFSASRWCHRNNTATASETQMRLATLLCTPLLHHQYEVLGLRERQCRCPSSSWPLRRAMSISFEFLAFEKGNVDLLGVLGVRERAMSISFDISTQCVLGSYFHISVLIKAILIAQFAVPCDDGT